MSEPIGLYIHIPYCLKKCAYCDFFSVEDNGTSSRYVDALMLHMQDYGKTLTNHPVDTVFIGGGTPTVLSRRDMEDLIENINREFNVMEDCEFTVEMNPATLQLSDLKSYRRAGVNRLSIGMQSANDDELQELGRLHTFGQVQDTFYDARDAGFDNINLDIMYGIPRQTPESFRYTLEKAVEMSPEHISVYGLMVEEGTPFYDMQSRGLLSLPDEDTEFQMYKFAVEFLLENGYYQYEISNFARRGKACRHNLKYWNCEEYLGLGPGAHSYLNGRRFAFQKDIDKYINAVENPSQYPDILSENYEIAPGERIGEYVMLQMRTKEGINEDRFDMLFHISFEEMYGKYLQAYEKGGFVEHKNGRYYFTLKGMYVSNHILSAMLDFDSDIIGGISDGSDR